MPPSSRNEETLHHILDTAMDLFARDGFDSISMSAIAEAAGVSKANIFHHFKSKDELYIQSLRRACDASHSSLEAMANGEGDAWQRIEGFLRAHLHQMFQQSRDSRLILREVVENRPGTAQRLAQDVFRNNFNRLVAIIAECQRSGALRSTLDPVFVSTLLLGTNVFFFQSQEILQHLEGVDFGNDPDRYVRQFMDIFQHGTLPIENSQEEV